MVVEKPIKSHRELMSLAKRAGYGKHAAELGTLVEKHGPGTVDEFLQKAKFGSNSATAAIYALSKASREGKLRVPKAKAPLAERLAEALGRHIENGGPPEFVGELEAAKKAPPEALEALSGAGGEPARLLASVGRGERLQANNAYALARAINRLLEKR